MPRQASRIACIDEAHPLMSIIYPIIASSSAVLLATLIRLDGWSHPTWTNVRRHAPATSPHYRRAVSRSRPLPQAGQRPVLRTAW